MPRILTEQAPEPTLAQWQERLLLRFPAAEPELLLERELRCRTDSKFVMSPSAAFALLPAFADHSAVLLAGTGPVACYRTLYFDTDDLACFHSHRRGRRVRHKVRIRHYPERHLTVLEVKTRRSETKTTKAWRPRPFGANGLSPEDQAFVSAHTGIGRSFGPWLWTNFRRVTLLGAGAERITIDLDIQMVGEDLNRPLAGIAIVEVKQWPLNRSTPIMATLRAGGFRPASISKYCAGIALTHPTVRQNRLRPVIRLLARGAA